MNEAALEKPMLRALAGEASPRPPFWLMRQAGRYLPEYRALRARAANFIGFCETPKLAAEATLQPVRRFGMDGAVVFSDILLLPRALGVGVDFIDGEGPRLEPLDRSIGARELRLEGLADRLAPVCETLALTREAAPPHVAIIGFAGAPWTLAAYMIEGKGGRDFVRARRWAVEDPEGFSILIGLLETAVVRHLVAQIDAGAEVVQLFDSWAGVLPANDFARWCVEPTARIAKALRAARPGVPVIGFPRGAGLSWNRYIGESAVDAVGLDAAAPAAWAAQALPAGMAIQGNLDPVVLAAGGEAMEREVRDLRRRFAGLPWIFNLGHGVLPETPPEHVAALARSLRSDPPS